MALYPGTAALKPRVHPGNQDNLSRTHSGCLYWYRSRHYDAARGRFGQADKWQNSVMNPVGFHAYGYVQGNPVRFVDPWGLFDVDKSFIQAMPNIKGLINETNTILNSERFISFIENVDYTFTLPFTKYSVTVTYNVAFKDQLIDSFNNYMDSDYKGITLSLLTDDVRKKYKLGKNIVGHFNYDTATIFIEGGMSERYTESVIAHELVHAAWEINSKLMYTVLSSRIEVIPIKDEDSQLNNFQEINAEKIQEKFLDAYNFYKNCAP